MPVIAKFPGWMGVGAWALAFIAGMINVVGLLGFEHQAITHLTGTTSMLGVALAEADAFRALHFASVIGAFVCGTMLSGFVVRNATLQLDGRYSVALLLEAVLLALAVPLLHRQSSLGIYAAACACGLQNAMVSTYSGTVVRTTHVSGMFTDLGIYLGHFLRGLPIDYRRVKLCVLVISGFLMGGVGGAAAFRAFGYSSLLLPAGCAATTALAHHWWRRRRRGAD